MERARHASPGRPPAGRPAHVRCDVSVAKITLPGRPGRPWALAGRRTAIQGAAGRCTSCKTGRGPSGGTGRGLSAPLSSSCRTSAFLAILFDLRLGWSTQGV